MFLRRRKALLFFEEKESDDDQSEEREKRDCDPKVSRGFDSESATDGIEDEDNTSSSDEYGERSDEIVSKSE